MSAKRLIFHADKRRSSPARSGRHAQCTAFGHDDAAAYSSPVEPLILPELFRLSHPPKWNPPYFNF